MPGVGEGGEAMSGYCPACGELVAITPGERIPPPPGVVLPTSARWWVVQPHELALPSDGIYVARVCPGGRI